MNPHCSATFRYLRQGQLFRVDLAEVRRMSALTGKPKVADIGSKTHRVEHFWLCEKCAETMTITLSESGEACLIAREASSPKPDAVEMPKRRWMANAS
jgi:hypothetical protein